MASRKAVRFYVHSPPTKAFKPVSQNLFLKQPISELSWCFIKMQMPKLYQKPTRSNSLSRYIYFKQTAKTFLHTQNLRTTTFKV